MTRRNKVRLAVSWWKAIKTAEWHRLAGVPLPSMPFIIYIVSARCAKREFFAEGNIVPLTIVYEDFIQEYEKTVRKILAFLRLNVTPLEISQLAFARTADDISEEWGQRFREELQEGWRNRGW